MHLQRGAVIDKVATYNAIQPGDSIPVLQAFSDADWDVNVLLAHDGDALYP
jgi:hypothetical protein